MTALAAPAQPELVEPSAHGLHEVFRRRYLLRLLVRRELNARFSGSLLGMIWSYINPAIQIFVYWFVFGVIMDMQKTENFPVHIFSGMVVIHFFTQTFNAGTQSIVRNKALVTKLPLPREMFPVASMLVSLFHMFPPMVMLAVVCVAYGWTPDLVGVAAGLLAVVLMAVLGTALALVFSVANVLFRDFGQVVTILTSVVRFSVPMIYPYTLVDDRFGEGMVGVYLTNPLSTAVLLMHRCFWSGTTQDPAETLQTHFPDHLFERAGLAILASLLLLVFAQLFFSRLEKRIPEHL